MTLPNSTASPSIGPWCRAAPVRPAARWRTTAIPSMAGLVSRAPLTGSEANPNHWISSATVALTRRPRRRRERDRVLCASAGDARFPCLAVRSVPVRLTRAASSYICRTSASRSKPRLVLYLRPLGFFTEPGLRRNPGVLHENTHQWYVRQRVAIAGWSDIWLNVEGLVTYAQWLWSEHDGSWSTT